MSVDMSPKPSVRWHEVQIIKSKKSKRCKDGTILNEFLLDEAITPLFIDYLKQFGKVQMLSDLDPPFYSCTMDGLLTMKGMVDDTSIHIRFNKKEYDTAKDLFKTLLRDYPGDLVFEDPAQ